MHARSLSPPGSCWPSPCRADCPRAPRDIGRRLYCRDSASAGRLEDDGPLATDPCDNRWPVFVVMPPARLALLAAPPCAASQRFLPTLFRLALLTSGVRELIRFHGAFQLTVHLIGQGRIAQPPAPAVAGPDMHPHLSRNAS